MQAVVECNVSYHHLDNGVEAKKRTEKEVERKGKIEERGDNITRERRLTTQISGIHHINCLLTCMAIDQLHTNKVLWLDYLHLTDFTSLLKTQHRLRLLQTHQDIRTGNSS